MFDMRKREAWQAGLIARQARDLAKASGRFAKADAIDAKLLTRRPAHGLPLSSAISRDTERAGTDRGF